MSHSEQDPGPAATQTLAAIRRDIDRVDADLVELIDRRLGLAAATADVKRRAGLEPTDGRREAEVVRAAAARARSRGIDPEVLREIFWRLIELSRSAGRNGRVPGNVAEPAGVRAGRLVDPYDVPAEPAEAPIEAPGEAPAVERPRPARRRAG